MVKYSFQVHRLAPSHLLAADATDEEVFERVWARLDMGDGWRGYRFLEEEGGLFLKGLAIPLRCRTQMWRRRWDVTREARKTARALTVPLEVPEIVGWGEENRRGIPRRSFLVSTLIRDSFSLGEIANDDSGALAASLGGDRERVFREAGALIRGFHATGVRHGDLAARNVLLARRPDGPHAMIIDIPRARWPRSGWRRNVRRRQDLYRITKSAIREGASEQEARALLDEAAGERAADVMAKTLLIKAIRQRLKRKTRSYIWRWTGI